MPDAAQNHTNARNLAADILGKESDRTLEKIRETAQKAIQAATLFGGPAPDLETLTAELAHMFAVRAGTVGVLDDDDPDAHKVWLPDRRAQIDWRFWSRYERYLAREVGLPPAVVNSLHSLTDKVLERLEDPARPDQWDRRGMVVGSVQSGKTANYTGLICKAIDAGYKLIVILAGIHSNLRSQTQLRIDEGVTGFDTRNSRKLSANSLWIGVGKNAGERYPIHSLTSSAEDGDFSKKVASQQNVMLGSDPVVLVVKKNGHVLKNLHEWVTAVAGTQPSENEKPVIHNVPLLLIDDEADNASINTKSKDGADPELDVSVINGRIRALLDAFEKSAYVGYTATPFANIFINPDAESPKHGADLFPRSFIINVEAPSNYVGPTRVFGLAGDPDREIPAQPSLNIVRSLTDYAAAFPPKHKIDHVPKDPPKSLTRAIRCFILICAARRVRNQSSKHNSMLVHVTRFQPVQNHTARLVRDELIGLQRRLRDGDGARQPTLRDELKQLWAEEFVPVSEEFGSEAQPTVTWEALDVELHAAAAKIDVAVINSSSQTPLDYKAHEAQGRSVIAIGGDKLSRGLTLEGLSVSYFLRASKMYDTLLQMGRWFGYRPGYVDLCRLFTTSELMRWYRHIALAEAELRREFDHMVATGQTPKTYGLRVRTHPAGMIVTALNKMSHSRVQELSWAGVLVQTTQFFKDGTVTASNLGAVEQFLTGLGAPATQQGSSSRIWKDVPVAEVAAFLSKLRFPPEAARAGGAELVQFIRKQADKPDKELTLWTVVVVSSGSAEARDRRTIAGQETGLVSRSAEDQTETTWLARKANIQNPADEALDFRGVLFDAAWLAEISGKPDLADDIDWLAGCIGRDAWDVALALTLRWQATNPPKLRSPDKGQTTRPYGRVLRVLRPRSRGLLLIYPLVPPMEVSEGEGRPARTTGLNRDGDPVSGVVLSFPASETVLGVEYRVNRVWDAMIRDDDTYDE
ncbi:Z1 domain-containing protein [Horticoccus luteus]|uniref:Z1 domain-containing protein n=1 Tax=Horticoccus luteus TaxID=2862869 RepID=A0A8F9TVR5_9BACT|nr:Z1 domain-containing protein [Horticoccus luteus]QYM78957.1 Z1 domain-containing protein [Horticoccus luteus]